MCFFIWRIFPRVFLFEGSSYLFFIWGIFPHVFFIWRIFQRVIFPCVFLYLKDLPTCFFIWSLFPLVFYLKDHPTCFFLKNLSKSFLIRRIFQVFFIWRIFPLVFLFEGSSHMFFYLKSLPTCFFLFEGSSHVFIFLFEVSSHLFFIWRIFPLVFLFEGSSQVWIFRVQCKLHFKLKNITLCLWIQYALFCTVQFGNTYLLRTNIFSCFLTFSNLAPSMQVIKAKDN